MNKVFIIAEAGVNHNGSIKIAKEMVDAAVSCGADAVKFQTFKAEQLVSRYALKAEYQKINTASDESQLEMLKKMEIGLKTHQELIKYCNEKKIIFLSSPFDLKSIDLLVELGLEIFKIPSGEITNLPYLRKIGALNKKLIISTGMSNLDEIEDAVQVIINAGSAKRNITLLHCTTEYPAAMEEINLRAMLTLKQKFGVAVGYSDHSSGTEVAVAAVALGASIIEKHFTLSQGMDGPDHKASLEPEEFRQMVKVIRNIEKALGDGIKIPSASELKNMKVARKSIVATSKIEKGTLFAETNIGVKRPGTGISPMRWDDILGRTAPRDFSEDELIEI
jgi:N,N'-diacetyllegionaminate synthase